MPRGAKRTYLLLAFAALVLAIVHLAPRVAQRAALDSVDAPFSGIDSYYHAHRTRLLASNLPTPVFHDADLFVPDGAIAEWPLGFNYVAAWPLALVQKTLGDPAGEAFLAWIPVGLSVFCLLIFIAVARRWFDAPEVTFLSSLAFSGSVAFILASNYGYFDHHVVETGFVCALFLLPSAIGSAKKYPRAVLGFGLAAAVWMSTLVVYLELALLFLWLLCRLKNSEGDKYHREWRHFAAYHLLPLLGFCLLESVVRSSYIAAGTLSLLQFAAALALLVAHTLVGRIKTRLLLVGGFVLGALAIATQPALLRFAFDYVRGESTLRIGQMYPIFMDADGPTFRFIRHYFGFLYPLYIVAFLAVRRRTPGFDAQPRHWFSLFLFVLSFSQIRFAHLFVPAWILMWFSLASTMKTQRARWLVCAALSLCLLEPTLATRNQFSRGLTPVEKITLDIAKFLESRPEPGHVSAPPNMGNQLLYLTKRGVVTTPFFLPKYLRRDLDLRDETDIMALIHSERSQGIRFIVAADDVRYHTMLKRMFHREVTESTFEADLAPCSPTHLAHAYYRLACIPRNRPGLTVLGTFVVPGAYFASLYRTATVYRID